MDPERELGGVLEPVAQLSVRPVMQTALETEVTTFLGRVHDGRGERAGEGHRNGYVDITILTTAGPVELTRPKIRGTLERSHHGCWASLTISDGAPGLCAAI